MIARTSQRKGATRISGAVVQKPPALVAILRLAGGSYSPTALVWSVPKTSKYTFHCFGGTGQYAKKTATLNQGTSMSYWVARGVVSSNSNNPVGQGGNEPTAIKGGGVDVNVPWGATPTGGDSYTPDGSIFAPFVGTVVGPGGYPTYGQHPGGGSWGSYSVAANGEIRIVDETPA